MPGQESTGGEELFGLLAEWFQLARKVVTGAAIFGLTVAMIAPDLFLGPKYLFAVASYDHVPLRGFAILVPWVITLSTTGLIYAMWSRPEGFKGLSGIDSLAVAIALADTLLDVGGWNAWQAHDPNVGSNVILSLNAPMSDQIWEVVIGLVCFAHMPLLARVLKRRQHKLNRAQGHTRGDQIEAGFIYLAGWVLNVIRGVAIGFGSLSMFCLDLLLTPLIGGNGKDEAGLFVVSVILTSGQYALWGYYSHTAREYAGGGDILSKATIRAFSNQLPQSAKIIWAGAWICTFIDSFLDLLGFNRVLYGQASPVPVHFTYAWLLLAFVLIAMCSAQAPLASEIFDPIARHYARRRFARKGRS